MPYVNVEPLIEALVELSGVKPNDLYIMVNGVSGGDFNHVSGWCSNSLYPSTKKNYEKIYQRFHCGENPRHPVICALDGLISIRLPNSNQASEGFYIDTNKLLEQMTDTILHELGHIFDFQHSITPLAQIRNKNITHNARPEEIFADNFSKEKASVFTPKIKRLIFLVGEEYEVSEFRAYRRRRLS